jgi:Flp pilus assembly pilin Flp
LLILGQVWKALFVSPVASQGGDACDTEPENSPFHRKDQFFDSPKGETKGMLDKLVVKLLTWIHGESGQDLVEYGLLTGGVAIALIAAVAVFSGAAGTWFNHLGTWFGNLAPR